jgi:sugar phosphate isomerase/epimerase
MRISINEDYLRRTVEGPRRTPMQTIQLVKNGGFDTVDFGMFNLKTVCQGQEHQKWVREHREFCDKLGVKVNQSHVPFFEGRPMPEGYVERLLQCVEDSAVLGADCVVVHGDTWYEPDYIQWDYDKVLNHIYEVFAPAVDRAAKLGIKIAFETLFEWQGSLYHRMRFSSFVEELDDLVGKFHCDTVGVCWDFGHAAMAYKNDQCKAMERLKSKIIATHTHDNIAKYDNHNLPYQGSINWEECMKTLAQKGYEGDLTLELGYGAIPEPLLPEFIRYAHKVGEHLVSRFDYYKKAQD